MVLGLYCYDKALFTIDETSYISTVCNCELRPLRFLLHRKKAHFKYQCGCVNFYFKSGNTTTVTFRMFEVVFDRKQDCNSVVLFVLEVNTWCDSSSGS